MSSDECQHLEAQLNCKKNCHLICRFWKQKAISRLPFRFFKKLQFSTQKVGQFNRYFLNKSKLCPLFTHIHIFNLKWIFFSVQIEAPIEMHNEIASWSAQWKGHVPENVQSNAKAGIKRKTFQIIGRPWYAKSMFVIIVFRAVHLDETKSVCFPIPIPNFQFKLWGYLGSILIVVAGVAIYRYKYF